MMFLFVTEGSYHSPLASVTCINLIKYIPVVVLTLFNSCPLPLCQKESIQL